MSGRYDRFFFLPELLYSEGCPVVIEKGALTSDSATGRVFAQLRIKNLSSETIGTARVTLIVRDEAGDKLGSEVVFDYENTAIRAGETFGQSTPIFVDPSAKSFEVESISLKFDNGATESFDELDLHAFPAEKPLDSLLDGEVIRFYRRRHSNDGFRVVPIRHSGIWRCACGELNLAGKPCSKCFAEYEKIEIDDPDALSLDAVKSLMAEENYTAALSIIENTTVESFRKLEDECRQKQLEKETEQARIRLEREQAREEELRKKAAESEAKRAEKRKKAKKAAKITGIVAVVAAISVAAGFIVNNSVIPATKYGRAEKLMESSDFDAANEAFIDLGDYKDSASQAKEARYRKAASSASEGDYAEAVRIFNELGGYEDSSELAVKYTALNNYDEAIKALDGGDYKKSIELLTAAGDVKDAAAKLKQANYLYGLELVKAEDYAGAAACFEAAGDYEDAAEQITDVRYLAAKNALGKGDAKTAYESLAALGDYKDSKKLLPEAAYKYGLELVKGKKYLEAIDCFKASGGYSDSKKQLLEAENQYVKANQNNADEKVTAFIAELKKNGYSLVTASDVTDVSGGSSDKKHVHLFSKGDTVAATCTAGGYTSYSCSCGAKAKGNITDKTGHDFSEADCKHYATCSKCGEKSGELGDHVWGEWHPRQSQGLDWEDEWRYGRYKYESRTCQVCGEELPLSQCREHSFVSSEIDNGNGGTLHGEKCTTCGLTPHDSVHTPGEMKEYGWCSLCNAMGD